MERACSQPPPCSFHCQTRILPSWLAAMVVPSGDHPTAVKSLNHTPRMGIPFGEGKSIAFPVVVFQMAYLPPAATSRATMLVPSGDQARLETGIPAVLREGCSTRSTWPLEGFTTWSPPLESPTARRVPSGDQAITIGHQCSIPRAGSCPPRIRSLSWGQSAVCSSLDTFQMRTRLPLQALFQVLATERLCGDQAIDQVPEWESGPARRVSSWPS